MVAVAVGVDGWPVAWCTAGAEAEAQSHGVGRSGEAMNHSAVVAGNALADALVEGDRLVVLVMVNADVDRAGEADVEEMKSEFDADADIGAAEAMQSGRTA